MKPASPSWDDLRLLLAVHRERSFLAAGRSLGVAPSTVARRVEVLERALRRPLVHRSNDGTRLTPDAARLVALAEDLELGLASLTRDARESDVSGTVRLSVPEGLIRPLLPTLTRLRARHPALTLELISESRVVDLARGAADIGIRMVPSSSPSVVSKALGRAPTALYASRAYVERRIPGARLPPQAAAQQDWVLLDTSLDHLPQQKWLFAYGASRFAFRSNSALAVEEAVLAGLGIGLLSDAQGRTFQELVRLETAKVPPPVELFLAFHSSARRTPRVRAVVKELEADIRRQLG